MTTIVYNVKTGHVAYRFAAGATNDDYDAACDQVKNPLVEILDELSLTELVKIYNTMSKSDIKKFSDKATAVERVEHALEAAKVPEWAGSAKPAPKKEKAAPAPKKPAKGKAAPKPAKGKAAPKPKKAPATHADRAAAIARSWQDAKVARARVTRHHVSVNGEDYRSTAEAFEQLGLPMKSHIKFRMALKASGKKVFEHSGEKYNFKAFQQEA